MTATVLTQITASPHALLIMILFLYEWHHVPGRDFSILIIPSFFQSTSLQNPVLLSVFLLIFLEFREPRRFSFHPFSVYHVPTVFTLMEALCNTSLLTGLATCTPCLKCVLQKTDSIVFPKSWRLLWFAVVSLIGCQWRTLPSCVFLSHEPYLLSGFASDSSVELDINGMERTCWR